MSQQITYFDNAATTFPKPEPVYVYHDKYLRQAANPGRGAHTLAMGAAEVVHESRTSVADLLGLKHPERLIFTPGCTYSINMAIKGFNLGAGDVVLVSAMEHNAVMRPLHQLEEKQGISISILSYGRQGIIDLHALVEAILAIKPKLCVFAEASNVTGETIDLPSVSAICAANKIPLILDAAQSAGRSPHNFESLGVAVWCASGHKGLFGPPGVGLMYVHKNYDLEPLVSGGTGSHSDELNMPAQYPDHLEAGTLPGPAIAGLGAASMWLKEKQLATVVEHEMMLTRRFLEFAAQSGFVIVYGNRMSGGGTSVVSFELAGVASDRVAQVLDEKFGIAVRSGLHCAATAHSALGTLDRGLVRVSFGFFNTVEEVNYLCQSLIDIMKMSQDGQL